MQVFIETDRLLIREVVEADAAGFFELDSDPEVHRFLGNKPISHIDQAKKTIQLIRGHYKENGIGRWAIIDKATNDFVGWTGLKVETQLRPSMKYIDLGYRIKQAYWGKGIATETAKASIDYGFNTLAYKEICGAADIENLASNHILTKVGLQYKEQFVFEGTTCNWYTLSAEKYFELISVEAT